MKFLAASIIDEKSKYASVCTTKSVCIQHYLKKQNNTKMIKNVPLLYIPELWRLFFKGAPPPLKRRILLRRTAPRLKTKKKQRSFATDQDPLGENYICDHCDPLLRNH